MNNSTISKRIGIDLEGEWYSKEEVKNMNFQDFKMFASFFSDKDFEKVCAWYGEKGIQHRDEILRSCNYSY